MQRDVERRIFSLTEVELRSGEDGRKRLIGYAALPNKRSENLGGFVEEIAPGAFAKVLNDDVRALWNHDPNFVFGRTTADTLKITEDGFGLRTEALPPDVQWANDFIVSIERGDVTQMSFAFEVEEDEWSELEDGLWLRRIILVRRLYDVSYVTFPAYPQTSVTVRDYVESLRARGSTTDNNDGLLGEVRAHLELRRRQITIREKEVFSHE